MILSALVGMALLAQRPFDFYAHGPYDHHVPRPESVLGYDMGSTHTTFRDQERALSAISDSAKARVKVFTYGKSTEGRPLKVFAISSPANIARLDEIRSDHAALAEPKPGQDSGAILKRTPVIVWVNECIHGDETASFESAMALLYNLAASEGQAIRTVLDNTVVILNPVYNPDGHERYVVYYNAVATGSPEPGAFEGSVPNVMTGRVNHYRFDMNRDRVAMSQAETKQEVAEFLRWNPQVYIDQHGQVSTYFFPPNAMSQNVNVDRSRVDKWTDVFGRATASAFDRNGWTYFVKDTFDLYYPGYLDAFTTLSGAIGMTHETDGGRFLARRRPDDSILTLRDGIAKHFTSALAVISAASKNRAALLDSYASFKRRAVSGELAGKFQRVIVTGDFRALLRLQSQLGAAGIRSYQGAPGFRQPKAHNYWTGEVEEKQFREPCLVIDMAQPQGALAKALLEPGADFEPEFFKSQIAKKGTAPEGEKYPGPEGTEFYDTTGWSLPFAHGLQAWWCESAPTLGPSNGWVPGTIVDHKSSVGYAVSYNDAEDAVATFEALRAGIRGMVTTRPMKLGDAEFPAGTFLFLAARNDPDFDDKLMEILHAHRCTYAPLETSYPSSGRQGPGTENVLPLKKPNVAIVFGDRGNIAEVGPLWYLMDKVFHLPFTPLATSALNGDLSKYTCIVMPGGSGPGSSKLKEWTEAGGCLVVLDNAGWAIGPSGYVTMEAVEGEHQGLPGALFKAELDPRSFLSYGYPSTGGGKIEVAVPIDGDTFYKARKEGGSIVTLSADEKVEKLLSGWEWPEETEKTLRGTVWLQEQPVGRGHAVVFTHDPTERAMWPGLYKLLLNAMLIGAGA